MIVYDVVQTVTPDAARYCSYPRGRLLVTHFDREADAENFALRCNDCSRTAGVRYDVVAVDELDPSRSYSG